jgi:hypothetical protein
MNLYILYQQFTMLLYNNISKQNIYKLNIYINIYILQYPKLSSNNVCNLEQIYYPYTYIWNL